ncbi:hypothetical protein KAW18_02075 [candidate division WOR-3 bacterium]|nr:hypothetical protein [candidate division WOR-3 bacterium]
MMDFSKDDIVVKKERDESDDRRWVVIKVFKETVWLRPIIDVVIIDEFLYKGVKKDIFKIIGRRRK